MEFGCRLYNSPGAGRIPKSSRSVRPDHNSLGTLDTYYECHLILENTILPVLWIMVID